MGSNKPVRNEREVRYEICLILEPTNDQLHVSGFIAQLVRASHRYREVTGSNPFEVLTFSGFYTQLLKLRS